MKDKVVDLGYLMCLLDLRNAVQFNWGRAGLVHIYYSIEYIAYRWGQGFVRQD